MRLEKAHQTSDRINILFILNRITNTFGIPNVFLIIYIRSKKMTKKNCCLSLRTFPESVSSLG